MATKSKEKYNQFIQSLGVATNSMSSLIKKSIIEKQAIDTGRMKNTSLVKIVLDDKNKRPKYVEIDSTYYYKFVDQGTRHITPRQITKWMRDQDKFKKEMARIMNAWMAWNIIKRLE